MAHRMGWPTSGRRGYGLRTLSATFRLTQVVRKIDGRHATLPEFGLDVVATFAAAFSRVMGSGSALEPRFHSNSTEFRCEGLRSSDKAHAKSELHSRLK